MHRHTTPPLGPTGSLLAAEHVDKIYRTGELSVAALVDLDLTVESGRAGRGDGPVRLRQDHAAQLPVRVWTTSTAVGCSSTAATSSR